MNRVKKLSPTHVCGKGSLRHSCTSSWPPTKKLWGGASCLISPVTIIRYLTHLTFLAGARKKELLGWSPCPRFAQHSSRARSGLIAQNFVYVTGGDCGLVSPFLCGIPQWPLLSPLRNDLFISIQNCFLQITELIYFSIHEYLGVKKHICT